MLFSKYSLFAAVAIPLFYQTPIVVQSRFEVASVKRNNSGSQGGGRLAGSVGRYSATNVPLRELIQVAYHVQDFQIIGAPAWIDSERYDIEGTAEADLSSDQRAGPFLRSLIEERFKAVMHGETRDLPVYFLAIAKSGSKLKASQCLRREPDKPAPPDKPRSAFCGYMAFGPGPGNLETSTQMQKLADALSAILKRKVLDRTGLAGDFDIKLKWTSDISAQGNNPAPDGGPSIFTAVEEQLGLKLEAGKAPIDVLVIDHIDHASEN
jgi:uncharacterized protein (TIGR03435 family)